MSHKHMFLFEQCVGGLCAHVYMGVHTLKLDHLSCSATLFLIPPESGCLTEPGVRLAGSKPHQSSCLCHPIPPAGVSVRHGYPRLFMWALRYELGSSHLCRKCSYPLCHLPRPRSRCFNYPLSSLELTVYLLFVFYFFERGFL